MAQSLLTCATCDVGFFGRPNKRYCSAECRQKGAAKLAAAYRQTQNYKTTNKKWRSNNKKKIIANYRRYFERNREAIYARRDKRMEDPSYRENIRKQKREYAKKHYPVTKARADVDRLVRLAKVAQEEAVS